MMIKLKSLIEMVDTDLSRMLNKIQTKQFTFIAAGDNGRVYEIDGEDRCFKITKQQEELDVAKVIVNKWKNFTSFIPVYYVNLSENMFIMANAEQLLDADRNNIDNFMNMFAKFSRNNGGEVSIFDFLDTIDDNIIDSKLANFLSALQNDVRRTGIPDLDLDLDFRSDNVMMWNGNLVLVDW